MRRDILAHRQLAPHTCVPACLRVVLHSLGVDLPEERCALLCRTTRRGTVPETVIRDLRAAGFDLVRLRPADLDSLGFYVLEGFLPIAFIRVSGAIPSLHAVVVCEVA